MSLSYARRVDFLFFAPNHEMLDEKGIPDPTFKKKPQSSSANNPDVSHFFSDSDEATRNTEETYLNTEQYFFLANFWGSLRDRQTSSGAGTNQVLLDNLISQLLEEANANAKGPPPASKKFLQNLPTVPKSEIKSGNVLYYEPS
ncbi:17812_t:CDS:2 [Acaulospora morrowiae]|uniref:17812_t:CDS:1 n=1 Tax=Acaulospora morrowiae TaxID=94023 RepID=A0A9N8V8N0_9GLOM|nr:17812_t:CDS:2 [Acaulospora morrowiae]